MKIKEKMNKLAVKATLLIREERGDTNFVSILVLLGIALALAAVFLAYKDDVLGWVDTNIAPFFDMSGGK